MCGVKIRAGGHAGGPSQPPARKYWHARERRARIAAAAAPIYIDSSRLPRPTRAPAAPPKAGANADDTAMGIAVIDGDIGPGDPNVRTTFTGDIGLRGAMACCPLPGSTTSIWFVHQCSKNHTKLYT